MLIAGSAGVAALLLTYPYVAALIKWAGIAICFSLRGSSHSRTSMRHART
jgi:arginine exporter protein ArgO